jgi:hypothetical protein
VAPEDEIRFRDTTGVFNGAEGLRPAVIQVEIDVFDFVNISFPSPVRAIFLSVYADVDIETRLNCATFAIGFDVHF